MHLGELDQAAVRYEQALELSADSIGAAMGLASCRFELAKAGEVRIIGVTSAERVAGFADAPTLEEQGIDVEFVNWRGFFAAPDQSADMRDKYIAALTKMYDTSEWEAVRARNGWVNIFNPGDEFTVFLTKQEEVISALMTKLGFL